MSKRKHFTPPAKRPVELTIWVGLLMAIGVIGVIGALLQGSAIGAVTALVLVGFAAGLWNWQKWGYYGVVVAFGLVILVAIAGGIGNNLATLAASAVILLITVVLIQPRLSMFR